MRVAILTVGVILGWLGLGPSRAAEGFRPRLNAVRLSSERVRQGDTISASYEFASLGSAPADEELTVFVHVRPAAPGDPDAKPAAGADFLPLTPTFAWRPGAVVEERDHLLRIPRDFPPGEYRVFIGLYDPQREARQVIE